MDDLKMQKQTLKKAYKKTKRKHITLWKVLTILCAIVMVISVPLTVLAAKFDNTMAARFGGSFWELENEDTNAQYYTSDFNSAEEMVNYGLALTQQVEAEGAALLMNNNNALPLAADAKVSTFSSSSVNLVYGGTGSGNIDASTADTLRTALEKVGVTVNPTLWDFYTTGAGKDYARSKSGTVAKSSEVTAEVPWDVYTDEVKDSVAQYGDAAIVTLSRVGGEGADLSYGEVNYLALDENEKAMLQNVAEMKKNGTVKKTILLINSANALQVDFLKNNEYDIDAALWIGDVGISGINAVAEILTGKVNPSGKLAESWAKAYSDTPARDNFAGDGRTVQYREGLYVGYRYHQTAGVAPAYPFGFGLSYTTFAYDDVKATPQGVSLTVTNTGDREGAEIVQVYVAKPDAKIFRPAQELKGFARVQLQPGESKTVTIPLDDKAFRYWNTKTDSWEVEGGSYELRVGASSADIRLTAVVEVAGTGAPNPYAGKHLPHYTSGKVQSVPDDEWATLLGRPVQQGKVKIDRNMTLGELNHSRSPLGWLIWLVLTALLNASYKRGKPDLNVLFQYNMPLRALAKMTSGAISMGMVDGIVMELQGFWIIGLVRVIIEAVKNLVLNTQLEQRLRNS